MKIAVIGGGNGGYAAAADLTFHGHKIFFWQRSIKNTKELIKKNNTIIMQDHNGKKKVKIYKVCTTLEQAVKNVKIVIILLPAFTQKEISKKISSILSNEQIIFLPPGSFGSWIFANESSKNNKHNIYFAESGTLPYLARKKDINTISIITRATRLPTGVYPKNKFMKVIKILKTIYPSIEYCGDILSAALMNAGPIIHPPLIILNVGPLEHFSTWDIHNEGTQTSIKKVIYALDSERIKLRKKLSYKAPHFPLSDHYNSKGEEWMYGNSAHKNLKISKNWREHIDLNNHRYILEDIKIGLSFMYSIAEWLKIKVPITSSLLDIGSILLGEDIKKAGRTLTNLNINNLSILELKNKLNGGK